MRFLQLFSFNLKFFSKLRPRSLPSPAAPAPALQRTQKMEEFLELDKTALDRVFQQIAASQGTSEEEALEEREAGFLIELEESFPVPEGINGEALFGDIEDSDSDLADPDPGDDDPFNEVPF